MLGQSEVPGGCDDKDCADRGGGGDRGKGFLKVPAKLLGLTDRLGGAFFRYIGNNRGFSIF